MRVCECVRWLVGVHVRVLLAPFLAKLARAVEKEGAERKSPDQPRCVRTRVWLLVGVHGVGLLAPFLAKLPRAVEKADGGRGGHLLPGINLGVSENGGVCGSFCRWDLRAILR